MKVGSLVECVKKSGWEDNKYGLNIKTPKKGSIYVVRGFYETKKSIYLEEIVNPVLPISFVEPSFEIECFVELLPPEKCSLEELFEEELEISK